MLVQEYIKTRNAKTVEVNKKIKQLFGDVKELSEQQVIQLDEFFKSDEKSKATLLDTDEQMMRLAVERGQIKGELLARLELETTHRTYQNIISKSSNDLIASHTRDVAKYKAITGHIGYITDQNQPVIDVLAVDDAQKQADEDTQAMREIEFLLNSKSVNQKQLRGN